MPRPRHELAPGVRLRIVLGPRSVLGPGKADLLEGIKSSGSIAAAGRALGMSYKRAWQLVEAMNAMFATPLVDATKGGAHGGGAMLTSLGAEVLGGYRELERATAVEAAPLLTALAKHQRSDDDHNDH